MICARVIGPYGSCPTTGASPASDPAEPGLGAELRDVVGVAEWLGLTDRRGEAVADGEWVGGALGLPAFVTAHPLDVDVGADAVAVVALADALAEAVADVEPCESELDADADADGGPDALAESGGEVEPEGDAEAEGVSEPWHASTGCRPLPCSWSADA